LDEHVRASSAGAAFAAQASRDFAKANGLVLQLDALKSISAADFGSKSAVHVCYMFVNAAHFISKL
jgi:hypothetical protein